MQPIQLREPENQPRSASEEWTAKSIERSRLKEAVAQLSPEQFAVINELITRRAKAACELASQVERLKRVMALGDANAYADVREELRAGQQRCHAYSLAIQVTLDAFHPPQTIQRSGVRDGKTES